MRLDLRIVPALVILPILFSAWPATAMPRPGPLPIERPGPILGEAGSRWIGPWVSESTIRVGEVSRTTVRWYDRDGSVLREFDGYRALAGVWPSTASLINGGARQAKAVFEDRAEELSAKVEELIFVYAKSEAEREAAALSLIRAGIPAEDALIRQVERGTGETTGHLLNALGRIRYRAAIPALIGMLRSKGSKYLKADLARTLGEIGAAEAAPEIKKLCGEVEFTAEWALYVWKHAYLPDTEPEVALLRLTADWGQQKDGIRALLLPPKEPGGPIALLLDNLGDEDRDVVGLLGGRWLVNGEAHEVGPMRWSGLSTLLVNYFWVWPFPAAKLLPEPGTYRLSYEVDGIASNEIEVTVK